MILKKGTQVKIISGKDRGKTGEILEIQKKFMELEREKGVTEKDIHHNPKGIVKEYKEEHEKLANRLVDIAHQIKGSIRT